MDESFFVSPSSEEQEFDLLDDFDDTDRKPLLPFHQPHGVSDQTAESIITGCYRYYWARGFWNFIASELGHLLILSWLVLFCIFLGSCIDYGALRTYDGSADTTLWSFIHFEALSVMSWYFVLALVLYGIFAVWRVLKFLRELRSMALTRRFFHEKLHMNDFDLRTARWSDVLSKLSELSAADWSMVRARDPDRLVRIAQSRSVVAAVATKKENAFQTLLESELLDHTLWFDHAHVRGLSMLTRGYQWNVQYGVINFFFSNELQIEPHVLRASHSDYEIHEMTSRLKKRVTIIAIVNILLIPFLMVFSALYAIFRYGEEFYKTPKSAGLRQWSLNARWQFREFNEMPHTLEERLRLAGKYALQYTCQFAGGPLQGVARAAAFVLGSMVVWMMVLSLINEHVLFSLNVSSGKTVFWWVTVLSSLWVACRGLLHEQHVFYPKDALIVVRDLVRHLPEEWIENAGSQQTLYGMYRLFPLRLTLFAQEFIGLFVTPWFLLTRIRRDSHLIVECMVRHLYYDEDRHAYISSETEVTGDIEEAIQSLPAMESTESEVDAFELLQSVELVPYLRNLNHAQEL